jgi:hypothetical protein
MNIDETHLSMKKQDDVPHDSNEFVPLPDEVDAADVLARLSSLFTKKNDGYGPTYLTQGGIMTVLFPDGYALKTAEDHNRFYVIGEIVMKLQRYCAKFADGGHLDSLHDMIVYSSMLAEIDENRIRYNRIYHTEEVK